MTRTAVTKLLILVILAFIICLPEFFTLYEASNVNFLCLPYRPCERGNQVKTGGNGQTGDAETRRKDMCDPLQTPEVDQWEKTCTQQGRSNMTDPASDPERKWFICETDLDMEELHRNISSSALKVHFKVSVELQLRDTETSNLTLYGYSDHSSLHLHPPEEEEEEEEEKKGDEGQGKAFYCCLPVPPTPESANQSRCLLWLSNQTVWTATAKEKLPWKRTEKDEWRCVFRVLWLALLCVVLLTIITTVFREIYRGKCKKPKEQPVGYRFTGQLLNDGGKQNAQIITHKGSLHCNRSRFWSDLSPIQEVDSQDDIETLMDGNVDHSYTANLHHRIPPPPLS
ncbi:uncharacterized protein LOC118327224 [Morone saxatilis]|uniref:uncharacterized protein LOC118327224 n=1 Tax=Morone saxatilis TaxID=34816 RepID=UPI0015E24FC8|nr:uncharacterized protein LOC118327224 [Morone saxatilis]